MRGNLPAKKQQFLAGQSILSDVEGSGALEEKRVKCEESAVPRERSTRAKQRSVAEPLINARGFDSHLPLQDFCNRELRKKIGSAGDGGS